MELQSSETRRDRDRTAVFGIGRLDTRFRRHPLWRTLCFRHALHCTHKRKGPPERAFFYKFNYWSRISAQHHRCNGKSFQCPSNVTVLVTIHYLWALLCSVVLVPHNLFITPVSRNLQRVVVRFFITTVQSHFLAIGKRAEPFTSNPSDVRFRSFHRRSRRVASDASTLKTNQHRTNMNTR